MKIPDSKPFGKTCDSFCRNWQTSKGSAYVENYDRIFRRRRRQPGFTKVVYANGQRIEYKNADALSPSQMGIKLKAQSI